MKNEKKSVALRLATIMVAAAAAQAAYAIPVDVTGLAVFRADRTANPIGFSTTALNVQVQVSPNSSAATQVFVSNSVDPSTEYQINRVALGVFAGQHIGEIAYNPALTGFWTARAQNGSDSSPTPAFRSAFLPIAAMPFVENISFTGTGNNITIHWGVGAEGLARLDRQTLSIWDITNPLAPFTVQFTDLDTAARQVALTGLVVGRTYAAEILNTDRNNANGQLGAVDAFSGTWLSGWIPTTGEVFVPVPEPASIVLILTGLAGLGFARRKRA